MRRSAVRRPVSIPSVTTGKAQTKDYQFVAGLDSNSTNDDVTENHWRYITDAREIYVGKWQTRQGNDFFSVPIGEAVNVQQTSVTGASNQSFSPTTWFAQKLVAASSGRLTALEANIRNTASGTGTIVLVLYTDSAGAPGTEVFRTTIATSQLTSSYQYLKARSITCPDIVSGTTYWVVGFVQTGGTNSYQISTTTTATTGLVSTTSGQSWSAQSFAFNVKLSTATASPVKGMIRLKRPNGTNYTFMAVGANLYSINELTGATTSVDSGLDAAATYTRFGFVNDTLYYVEGTTKPRKYDFATASSVATAPENAMDIMEHKGLLFYQSAIDPSKTYYTNFGLYDTFTSTDFFYVPSPKTSDPQKASARLNGNLYVITRANKYVLYGAENATFRLDNAIGQKGTFSQESVTFDEDNIYLASDDGIYQFNGAEEKNICVIGEKNAGVLDWWNALQAKSNTVLELHNNRLYVFYTPVGQSQNTRCRVYNVLYGIWESDDTLAYVQRTYTRHDQDYFYLQGSNRVGMVMIAEQASNDYNSMGEPFTFELRTSYNHYGTPAQYKRAPNYRPHFDTVSGTYAISAGYALDYNDTPQYTDISLSGTGPRFDAGYTYDSGIVFGGTAQVNPMDEAPSINGQWRRMQIRYKHYAAREAVTFDGHVLNIETQRLN